MKDESTRQMINYLENNVLPQEDKTAREIILSSDAYLLHDNIYLFIYLFEVLRRFQHCTGHITTGSWKGRGNQYIKFARVVYCKLPTNGKQLPAFPLTAMMGIEPRPQRWKARVLPLCHRGPFDNILYHLLDAKSKDTKRQIEEIRVWLVVRKELRFDVLTSMHGDLNSGHYGTQRTYSTLRLKYYWKGMYSDCKNFVLSCEKCSTKKKPVAPVKAPL